MRLGLLSGVLSLFLLSTTPLVAQEDIFLSGDDFNCCAADSRSDAATGQTFSVPEATSPFLNSFSFWESSRTATASLGFQAFLYEWDATGATPIGPELYRSSIRSSFGVEGEHSFAANVALDPTREYVAFVGGWGFSTTSLHFTHGADNGPGMMVFSGGEASVGDAVANSWGTTPWDMKFAADFSAGPMVAVPEPASGLLLLPGLLFLLTAVRRERVKI